MGGLKVGSGGFGLEWAGLARPFASQVAGGHVASVESPGPLVRGQRRHGPAVCAGGAFPRGGGGTRVRVRLYVVRFDVSTSFGQSEVEALGFRGFLHLDVAFHDTSCRVLEKLRSSRTAPC